MAEVALGRRGHSDVPGLRRRDRLEQRDHALLRGVLRYRPVDPRRHDLDGRIRETGRRQRVRPVFSFADPPEQKARWATEAAASFSNAVARLKRGEEVPPSLSDDDCEAIKRAPAAPVELL